MSLKVRLLIFPLAAAIGLAIMLVFSIRAVRSQSSFLKKTFAVSRDGQQEGKVKKTTAASPQERCSEASLEFTQLNVTIPAAILDIMMGKPIKETVKSCNETLARITSEVQALQKDTSLSSAETMIIADIEKKLAEYKRHYDKVIEKSLTGDSYGASESYVGLQKPRDEISVLFSGLLEQQAKNLRKASISIISESDKSLLTVVVAGVCSFIMVLAISLIIGARLSSTLSSITSRAYGGANYVEEHSSELTNLSQELADKSAQQAANLEEISATMEQISSATEMTADHTIEAQSKIDGVKTITNEGMEAMANMSEVMSSIHESSTKTAGVIKTIDEIAFQTNLLALNASVEAARAGDAGKGFAVVAEEVRTLAQRSAEAARDTARLIEEAQRNAADGVTATDRVRDLIEQTAESVKLVSGLVSEVSAATSEQRNGIGQINQGVAQLNNLTQGTAADAEETAAASQELQSHAGQLVSLVDEIQAMVTGAATSEASQGVSSPSPVPGTGTTPTPGRAAVGARLPAPARNNRPEKVIPLDSIDLDDF